MTTAARGNWEQHWRELHARGSVFGFLTMVVRTLLLNRAVKHYAELYFSPSGRLVELGCGTGQASTLIPRRDRQLIGLDFSAAALRSARECGVFSTLIQGDIICLPFADSSIDGGWNLGVMEHFEEEAGIRILQEVRRVLKPGAKVVLFWPPELGSSRLVLAPLEHLRSWLTGRKFRFFPDEVNRVRSRKHARQILRAAGFEVERSERTWRDAFIHLIVVGRKP